MKIAFDHSLVAIVISVTRFGEISPLKHNFEFFGIFLIDYSVFGKIVNLFWQIFNTFGQIFIVLNGQILI